MQFSIGHIAERVVAIDAVRKKLGAVHGLAELAAREIARADQSERLKSTSIRTNMKIRGKEGVPEANYDGGEGKRGEDKREGILNRRCAK